MAEDIHSGSMELISAASGLRVGRFQILGHYASGGTSELWVALKDGAREVCLLKQLSLEYSHHELARKRLMREAQIASRLDHPNVGKVLTAGFEAGRFCLSADLIRGQSLASMMKRIVETGRGAMPAFVAIPIMLRALDGLGYLHDFQEDGKPLELVHRDLSLGNIVVGFDGSVRIIDFGTARAKIDDFRTAPGVVLGTPEYMSPEQAMAEPIDRRSDLYTLGVALYEILTGREVVPRELSLVDALEAVRKSAPTPVSRMNPMLPGSLDAVLAKALAKAPQDRFANARDMQASLRMAASALADTPPEAIGRYLLELMPDEEKRIATLCDQGRRLAEISHPAAGEESLTHAAPTHAASPLTSVTEVTRGKSGSGRGQRAEKTAVIARKTATSGERSAHSSGEYRTPAVMEMPGTAAIAVTTRDLISEAARLRARIRLWRVAFVAVATCLIAAVAVIAVNLRERSAPLPSEPPTPAFVRPADPTARAGAPVAEEEAVPTTIHPEPILEAPKPEAPKTKRRAVKNDVPTPPPGGQPPAPPEEARPTGRNPRLVSMLRELQAAPRDARLFEKLLDEIAKSARALPEERRRLVLSDLEAAERTFDVDLLGEALRKLNSG